MDEPKTAVPHPTPFVDPTHRYEHQASDKKERNQEVQEKDRVGKQMGWHTASYGRAAFGRLALSEEADHAHHPR